MPAGDTAPDVGTMLKANMSQPIRKGVAKWTDTVRKMEVSTPRRSKTSAARRRSAVAPPPLAAQPWLSRLRSADARGYSVKPQVGEEVEVLETQINPENNQIRCERCTCDVYCRPYPPPIAGCRASEGLEGHGGREVRTP